MSGGSHTRYYGQHISIHYGPAPLEGKRCTVCKKGVYGRAYLGSGMADAVALNIRRGIVHCSHCGHQANTDPPKFDRLGMSCPNCHEWLLQYPRPGFLYRIGLLHMAEGPHVFCRGCGAAYARR